MESFKSRSPLAKRMIIMIIILVVFFGGIFAFDFLKGVLQKRFFASFKLPPVTISTTKSHSKNWQPYISVVGTMVAVNGVSVTSQVSGQVIGINFQSGQFVRTGQVLVRLDDRMDREDLANYIAQLNVAKTNYQRQLSLLKTKSTSQSAVDSAYAQLQQNQAQVDKVSISIDQKNIKAPFDGKIGIRTVNLGQYVSPGTPLVSLQSLNPMLAQFSLPEQYFKSLFIGQPIEMTVTTYGEEVFRGKLSAVDATFSSQTRNLLIQAVIPNDNFRLYPGMSANIHVLLPVKENVVTVPQTAVDFSLFGDSVFIVKQEGKDDTGPILIVHRRYVTTGDRQGNEVAIVTGLKPGEEVVTSGQLKLDDGTRVKVNNSVDIQRIGKQITNTT